MKTLFSSLAASALAAAVIGSGAFAQGAPMHKKLAAAPKTMKCPVCHMQMPTQATKTFPVAAVKVNGTTYYCCAQCAAGKKAMKANAKSAKKAPAKGAASGAPAGGGASQ